MWSTYNVYMEDERSVELQNEQTSMTGDTVG